MDSTVTLTEVANSFNAALESLGDVVRDVIYDALERNGIDIQEIPLRIPDVVIILRKTVGGGTDPIVHKMLAEFRRERFKARISCSRENDLLAEIHSSGTTRSSVSGMSA